MYTVEERSIIDMSEESGIRVVYDVIGEEGEMIYTGCDWETAQCYMEISI